MDNDKRYNWLVLQEGHLFLKPDGGYIPNVTHQCTSILIYPEGGTPTGKNTVLTDPYFTDIGFCQAESVLEKNKLSTNVLHRIFITHKHGDHMLHLPDDVPIEKGKIKLFKPGSGANFSGIQAIACPGHSPDLKALVFRETSGKVIWVVGDAVIDEEWLRAWMYYFPNGYGTGEIILTWKSTARILSHADIIIPGHGKPIEVTAELVGHLLLSFHRAEHSSACPEVAMLLLERLNQLSFKVDSAK